MSHDTTIAPCCKGSSNFWSKLKRLLPTGSRPVQQITSKPIAFLATAAATGLVLASAGFGAYYAFTTGSQHGLVLACLMTLMAVALETAKPLALVAAFSAFRSWSIIRGAALAVLAVVAIAYSLTAELSLMATSRGDVVAIREASIKAASNTEFAARQARERYDAAKAELSATPVTKPAEAIQAEIDGLLLTPGADGCVAVNGKVTRDICPKVSTLRAEKAVAVRRSELEQIIAKPLPTPVASNSGQQGKEKSVGKADPAASALSAYLAVFGIMVAPAVLSEWLVLIPVLALEVGSAFAGVLVQSVASRQNADATRDDAKRKDELSEAREEGCGPLVVHPAKPVSGQELDQAREKVKKAIVTQLRERGGSVSSGERGLAKLIGANRSTMKRAINGLVIAGVIAAEASRNGTILRLVA